MSWAVIKGFWVCLSFLTILFPGDAGLLLGQEGLPKKGQDKGEGEIKAILVKMDELYRSTSSTASIEMEITTPHWQRTLKMDFWSLGKEKTFIRIVEPRKERGIATLRVGNEMWNFLPKTHKTMKIPPSMMMGSWMGSDFTNDDLVKEYTFIDDYQYREVQSESHEPGLVTIRCTPKADRPIVWGWIDVAVKDKGQIPVWYRYYDEKGKLMREMVFREIKDFGGRRIPSVLELLPAGKEGHRTIIRYLDLSCDKEVDQNIFSLRNLRQE